MNTVGARTVGIAWSAMLWDSCASASPSILSEYPLMVAASARTAGLGLLINCPKEAYHLNRSVGECDQPHASDADVVPYCSRGRFRRQALSAWRAGTRGAYRVPGPAHKGDSLRRTRSRLARSEHRLIHTSTVRCDGTREGRPANGTADPGGEPG